MSIISKNIGRITAISPVRLEETDQQELFFYSRYFIYYITKWLKRQAMNHNVQYADSSRTPAVAHHLIEMDNSGNAYSTHA